MNDQSFFDLAMKVIARQATDAERANLDALLAQEPKSRAEFERLETDARVAKDALSVISACTASTGEFPAYARERLQTAVRETLGRPKFTMKEPRRGWRWVLGLAIATAVVLLLALPVFRHSQEIQPNTPQVVTSTKAPETPNAAPAIELAMLDTGGEVSVPPFPVSASPSISGNYRAGKDTNEVATLKETWKKMWKGVPVQNFSSVSELQAWEKNWPNDGGPLAVKIVYAPAVGEVWVSGRSQGRVFEKTFPVERDLATTLQQVRVFIAEDRSVKGRAWVKELGPPETEWQPR